jgi:hypothetical protein
MHLTIRLALMPLTTAWMVVACSAGSNGDPRTPGGAIESERAHETGSQPRQSSQAPPSTVSVPQELVELGNTLMLQFSLQPVHVDSGPGPQTLRSVALHIPIVRFEPHSFWQNGTQMSANARITLGEGEAMLRALATDGFFARAQRSHSERQPRTSAPRPPGRDGPPDPSRNAHVSITITVHDDDWYQSFSHDVVWGSDAGDLLRRVGAVAADSAARLLDQLQRQLPRPSGAHLQGSSNFDVSPRRSSLRQLAASTSHFATGSIIRNRWLDGRWPPELLRQQDELLTALKAMRNAPGDLRAALGDPDPKVRTLALGALFVREDPRDLPFIAVLQSDSTATMTHLQAAATSQPGPLPVERFESPQTVGDVATKMIRFWLDAAAESYSFEQYWTARGGRERCASWFLARMHRATRRTTPLQPQYEQDVERVLADIDALPDIERAWTLLYVHPGLAGVEKDREAIIPDSTLIAALTEVGPDALMKFLRREPVSDDPDLRPALGGSYRAGMTYGMISFILKNAVDLLRPSDSDAVLAEASRDLTYTPVPLWISATAQLRGLTNMDEAVRWLKGQIAAVPPTILTPRVQALLTTTLWRMRGAAERDYLTGWFYSVLPGAQENGVHGPVEFLRGIQKFGRADTDTLLAAIVNDSRFDRTDWATLAELLQMLDRRRSAPLVERPTIYDYRPPNNRPDHIQVLAGWRELLRQQFRR